MKVIAYIHTDFPEKFGLPRQSGLAPNLGGKIVFEPEYRSMDGVKGLEGYDYIWLLWKFQGVEREHWSATVKPPRLGGNTHVGVFSTRSPFRPNPIGLSAVKLESILETKQGPELVVSGIDMKHMTPIYDIKPYLPHTDSYPLARGGFAAQVKDYQLEVEFPKDLLELLPTNKQKGILEVLRQDPRPAYHQHGERKYGVSYAGFDIRFTVENNRLLVFQVIECCSKEE